MFLPTEAYFPAWEKMKPGAIAIVDALVLKFHVINIQVEAKWFHMCCLPHTIHLSVLEVS